MPRQVALLFCILLISCLFLLDRKNNQGVSKAIWIPFIWIIFAASREFSFWIYYFFNIGSYSGYSGTILEGNPYDRALDTFLIIVGIIILIKRSLNWTELFSKNIWIWMYFIFGAFSIIWSDFPFVSTKRLIKAMGNIIMVSIILTEERPLGALGLIIKRYAFILLPLSLLFIRYYPELGRGYNFQGTPMLRGVAGQKNGLGQICMISIIYFTWFLLFYKKEALRFGSQLHYSVYLIIFPLIVWLLHKANSATALTSTIVVISFFMVARQPAIIRNPRRLLPLSVTGVLCFSLINLSFNFKGIILQLLGRRPDLTTRIPMWQDLLDMVKNPLIGYGFESFWLGQHKKIIIEKYGVGGQAHNGYIQLYLDLGYIGLFILFGWILSGLKNVNRDIVFEYSEGVLKLSFIIVVLVYNLTEATFYGISNIWLLLFFSTMKVTIQKNIKHNIR
jgi:O-antigen ligase